MFSVLSRLIGHLLQSQDNDDDDRESPSLEASGNQLPWLLDIDSTDTGSCKTRCFEGTVTHVFSGQGLIDGEIYFSFSALSAGKSEPKVGDVVYIVAKQQHENGGWHAESVTITSKGWEDEEDSSADEKKTAFIGKVTHVGEETGLINHNIEFDVDDCLNGYTPHRGDWVTARFEGDLQEEETGNNGGGEDDDNKRYAVDVEPLRSWTFEGVISAAMEDHGYIDGEVYYEQSACLNGYRPSKRNFVKVTAIESHQGKLSWRAVSIVPLSTNRVPNYGQSKTLQYQQGSGWLIPGQKPKMFAAKVKLPQHLPQYPVSSHLRNCVLDQEELTQIAPYLAENLCLANYIQRFSTLLHLEEIQQDINIQEFDMNRVCLRPCGQYLALLVPGLAEGRPSVMMGDKILLSCPVDPGGPRYEGFVHEVTTNEVLLKFNADFHSRYNGEDYNVQFTSTRTPLRRCHQAVRLAVQHLKDTVLFPLSLNIKPPQLELKPASGGMNVVKLPNYKTATQKQNKKLSASCGQTNDSSDRNSSDSQSSEAVSGQTSGSRYISGVNTWVQDRIPFINQCLNDRQKMAVIKILLGQSRPLPYVIFGPPGTGKTITVVESILQVFTQLPSSRILASTPSNSAADLLAERLVQSGLVKTSDMVRLNAFQRSGESIPESVECYCCDGTDLALTSKYRIVVCTCVTAGSFLALGLTAGYFTHVFVDECGQATEPECLIPLGLVAGADGQIILAGDPRQLGPVLMSTYAKMYGLDLSFLERIMTCPPYTRNPSAFADNGGFDSLVVTMLADNYRSHPAILALPSKLFYYSELKECADPSLTHRFCGWHKLPRKDFPIIFHGVKGEDVRDGGSPSWYNPMETVLVVQYLQALLEHGPFHLDTDNIGIITPYRKQVEKIRLLIDKLNVPRVKVGSVEEFQGQERLVIIISTVRSSPKLMGFDLRHTLGFLSNAKRFNVSITRAQALLLVIGDPHTLAQDTYWMELIKYCADNGAYVGCDLPTLEKEKSEEDCKNSTEQDASCRQTDDEKSNMVKNKHPHVSDASENMNHLSNPGDAGNTENDEKQNTAKDHHTTVLNTGENMNSLSSPGYVGNTESDEKQNTAEDHHTAVLNTGENMNSLLNSVPNTGGNTDSLLCSGDHVNTENYNTLHTSATEHGNGAGIEGLDLLNNDVLNKIRQASVLEAKLRGESFSVTNSGDGSMGVVSKVELEDILSLGSLNGGSRRVPSDAVWCSDIEHVLQNGSNSFEST
ncbi:RNA helicase Mov10l1-like [Gigantopelta aegis]|uniref:RNA helicase Mov10l1-like n=1 Tax=Gigantopelta aegis TaxID=1735272 RepID=UPI001B889410|nr:RNA helicase Mov10l1-like [Gigantopelta aegis]